MRVQGYGCRRLPLGVVRAGRQVGRQLAARNRHFRVRFEPLKPNELRGEEIMAKRQALRGSESVTRVGTRRPSRRKVGSRLSPDHLVRRTVQQDAAPVADGDQRDRHVGVAGDVQQEQARRLHAGEVNGAMITLLASGTRTVRANQPGDAIYAPDPVVSRTFGVN